jgi:Na+/H+-dicarboxylate symporter
MPVPAFARNLTFWIVLALVAGLVAGWLINSRMDAESAAEAADALGIVTDIFLRFIKMIIAPLVMSALISGIGHMGGDVAALGRIGGRAIGWFLATSMVALLIGAVLVTWMEPGVGLNLPIPERSAAAGVSTEAFTLRNFIVHLVPRSVFEALADNEILQIVVFSVLAGIAVASLGETGKPILRAAEAVMQMMLKITGYVMYLAPAAVFAAVAATIGLRGLEVIGTYGLFMGGFYFALILLLGANLFACGLVIGFPALRRLVMEIRAPFVLAFSTASSEAAYPRLLDALVRFGIPVRIASFVLPLGYSFNLDGSMMYAVFASIFIAQAYGIELSALQIVGMCALLMVTSKGIAGVPRASLVVIAATLPVFGIPEAGLLLILGVDHFLDMGRSATNAVGNAVATAAVSKWEMDREARETARQGAPQKAAPAAAE